MRAKVHLTAEDDGLSAPWRGVVFVNPPYGRALARWVAKARREVELGHARTVVALLPARPDTAYWHDHVAGRAAVYFLRGRLRFGDGGQSAPFPSALAVWGAGPGDARGPRRGVARGLAGGVIRPVRGRFSCVLGIGRRTLCVFQPLLMRPADAMKARIPRKCGGSAPNQD